MLLRHGAWGCLPDRVQNFRSKIQPKVSDSKALACVGGSLCSSGRWKTEEDVGYPAEPNITELMLIQISIQGRSKTSLSTHAINETIFKPSVTLLVLSGKLGNVRHYWLCYIKCVNRKRKLPPFMWKGVFQCVYLHCRIISLFSSKSNLLKGKTSNRKC